MENQFPILCLKKINLNVFKVKTVRNLLKRNNKCTIIGQEWKMQVLTYTGKKEKHRRTKRWEFKLEYQKEEIWYNHWFKQQKWYIDQTELKHLMIKEGLFLKNYQLRRTVYDRHLGQQDGNRSSIHALDTKKNIRVANIREREMIMTLSVTFRSSKKIFRVWIF